MSSGGWEIVCKKNKDKSSNGKPTKLTKAEKKNFLVNAPKLEDFLPLNEVKSLYDSLDGNKENKKPSKEKDSKSKENEEKKRQQKLKQQQAEKNKKLQQQKTKEKLPKSEKSSAGINIDEINELLENDKVKFPDAPLIWLKDLISYLDTKLPADKEDPSFQTKPDTYPLSLVSKAVRSTLEKTIKIAGAQNAQLCWEGTLTTMIRNISNGTPDMGCKIFLQLLSQTNPEMTVLNLQKLASLRNSYQNKKSIGLSLLWAFAQGGKKNLGVGLTIWHEIMAPMMESRSYALPVLRILNELLVAKNSNNLTIERYFDIIEDLCSGKINTSSTMENDFAACMTNLRVKMVKSEQINSQKMFETLMTKITPKTNSPYKDEILRAMVACMIADPRCFAVWTNLYPKNLYQSDLLLKHLLADWNTLHSNVPSKALKETLENLRASSDGMSRKGKEEILLQSCKKVAETLVEKMSASKKRESSFPWKKGSIILLALIAAVVTFDCHKHGSFEASSTGKFLKTSGAIQYGNNAWSVITHYKDTSLNYLESNYPEYYKAAAEFSNKYYRLVGDLYLITRNISVKLYLQSAKYIAEKKPLVTESFEHYFPGLLDSLQKRSLIEIERVKTYSSIAAEHVVVQSTSFVRWLETSVFVGNLSPENLRGYATQAVTTTQKFAGQTYDWVYEKVQTLSKVQ